MADTVGRPRGGWLVLGTIAGMLACADAIAQPTPVDSQAALAATGTVVRTASIAHVRGIRTGKRDGAVLVEESRHACPTVQRLLDALQQSDVVVLVEVCDRVLNRTGHLTFIGTSHGTRWLRITIDGGNRQVQQAAWLAHELQHAVEVALAHDVKDVEGLRRLYARIGTARGDGQFETDAAVAAGKQALREVYEAGRR
jgi:hypothetical protein